MFSVQVGLCYDLKGAMVGGAIELAKCQSYQTFIFFVKTALALKKLRSTL
jgi:hypothetical protein